MPGKQPTTELHPDLLNIVVVHRETECLSAECQRCILIGALLKRVKVHFTGRKCRWQFSSRILGESWGKCPWQDEGRGSHFHRHAAGGLCGGRQLLLCTQRTNLPCQPVSGTDGASESQPRGHGTPQPADCVFLSNKDSF